MIFVLDNYDSFTYNLVQYLGELGATLEVRRNNQITLDEIASLAPTHIVISPGPGRPEDAGVTPGLIERFAPTIPILGVCLGHQAIGMVCGGRVVRAPVPMHGKTSVIEHDGRGVFTGLASPIEASRYHSLVVDEQGLPEALEISARSRGDGIIMGLRHRAWPLQGVQFHPESVLTSDGRRMLRNFLDGK
jgi:anthranilate synthase/aminodeoxychorismate synthase-like glutamine amidotransferase